MEPVGSSLGSAMKLLGAGLGINLGSILSDDNSNSGNTKKISTSNTNLLRYDNLTPKMPVISQISDKGGVKIQGTDRFYTNSLSSDQNYIIGSQISDKAGVKGEHTDNFDKTHFTTVQQHLPSSSVYKRVKPYLKRTHVYKYYIIDSN